MKALVCHQYGPAGQLTVEHREDPQPGKGQVLVEVHAAALNFPDTLQIQGKYQFQPPLPFIPGSEVAGTVLAVGDGVQQFQPGERVMAFPGIGGMAGKVVAPASAVRSIPDNMDFRTAAGFAMVYTTSYYALKQRAQLKAGETLLVLGASGGGGMAAVERGVPVPEVVASVDLGGVLPRSSYSLALAPERAVGCHRQYRLAQRPRADVWRWCVCGGEGGGGDAHAQCGAGTRG